MGRLLNIINSPTCLRYKSIGPFFSIIWIILQFILMCIVVKSIATWLKNENIFYLPATSPPHDIIRNLIFGLNGSNFDLLRTINSGKKCFDQTWDLPPFSASNWFSGNCHRGNISRNTIYIFTFLKTPFAFIIVQLVWIWKATMHSNVMCNLFKSLIIANQSRVIL